MSQTPNPKNPKTPKGNNPKGFKQPNRTNMVTIVVFIIIGIFFVFMMARTMTSATGVTQTDELQTSEFMQAVDQGRVSTAVYDTRALTPLPVAIILLLRQVALRPMRLMKPLMHLILNWEL